MRILLDQCTPAPIREYLINHEVITAHEQGWSTLSNGDLLKTAEDAGFDVLLTTDTHLRDQQNLKYLKLAVVVLSKNKWVSIQAAMESVIRAVNESQSGRSWVEIP